MTIGITGKRTTVSTVLFAEIDHAKQVFIWSGTLQTWFKVSKSEIRRTISNHWRKDLMISYRVDDHGVWID